MSRRWKQVKKKLRGARQADDVSTDRKLKLENAPAAMAGAFLRPRAS